MSKKKIASNTEITTKNPQYHVVMRKLTEDELIELAIKLWQPLFKNKRFKKGQAAVFIKEPEFRTINVIIHSSKPIVKTLTLSKNENMNKICNDIIKIYSRKEYYIIKCGKKTISKFISRDGRLILSAVTL